MELARHYFPLSPDQKEIEGYFPYVPTAMFNMPVRIDINSEIDEQLFEKAFALTVQRLPYARCRLHCESDGTNVQYLTEMEEQQLPTFTDCTAWSEEKLTRQISKWAGIGFPNKLLDTQLFRAELLRLSDNRHCFFFCSHHIIMDIYAVVFFVMYLDKVYYALISNTALPKEGTPPETAVLARNSYLESERSKRDLAWWKKEYSTEPQFTSLNGLGGKEFIKGKRYGHDRNILLMKAKEKVFEIPADLENAVLRFATEQNRSPSMIYYLALRCYISAVCKTEDVSFYIPYSLRSTLAQKSSGLTAAGGFNLRTTFSNRLSFAEALSILDTTDKNCLRHIETPDKGGLLNQLWNCPQGCLYWAGDFSYIPYINYDEIHLDIRATKIDSGVSLAPIYILVMHTQKNENLKMIYQYASGYIKPENIDRCHAFILKFLRAGIANPDRAVDELMTECL